MPSYVDSQRYSTVVVISTVTVTPTRTISGCQDPFATPAAKRRAVDASFGAEIGAPMLEARAVRKPSVLTSYRGTALTSACSCLTIPTGTTTVTERAARPARSTVTADATISTRTKTRTITRTADQTETEYSLPEPTLFKLVARFAPEEVNGGRLGALRQADNGYDEIPPWTVWKKDYAGLNFRFEDDGSGGRLLQEVRSEQYALQFADDESFSIPDIIYFANGDNFPDGGTYLSAFLNIQTDQTCVLGLRNAVTGDQNMVICDYRDSSGTWYAKLIPNTAPAGEGCDNFSIFIISL